MVNDSPQGQAKRYHKSDVSNASVCPWRGIGKDAMKTEIVKRRRLFQVALNEGHLRYLPCAKRSGDVVAVVVERGTHRERRLLTDATMPVLSGEVTSPRVQESSTDCYTESATGAEICSPHAIQKSCRDRVSAKQCQPLSNRIPLTCLTSRCGMKTREGRDRGRRPSSLSDSTSTP